MLSVSFADQKMDNIRHIPDSLLKIPPDQDLLDAARNEMEMNQKLQSRIAEYRINSSSYCHVVHRHIRDDIVWCWCEQV